MNLSMIAALTRDRSIGKGPELLVRIPDDLKRFKALTTGRSIIMGRKTFQSIGRPLPNRTNLVVTRDQSFKAEGAVVCTSLDEAIEKAGPGEVFIIGGGELYAQGLPRADKLYLTLVDSDICGDVFFPDYSEFKTVLKREDRTDEKTGLNYSWIDLER